MESEGALYGSLPVFTGIGGWELASPGNDDVQVALRLDGDDLPSNPLLLKIAPPFARSEERFACTSARATHALAHEGAAAEGRIVAQLISR